MEDSKSSILERMAREARVPFVASRLTPTDEQDLLGIPVMDSEDAHEAVDAGEVEEASYRVEMLPREGPGPVFTSAEQAIMDLDLDPVRAPASAESAPISVAGRIVLSQEMVRRVMAEIDAARAIKSHWVLDAAYLKARECYLLLDDAEDSMD